MVRRLMRFSLVRLVSVAAIMIFALPAQGHYASNTIQNQSHCTLSVASSHVNGVEMWGSTSHVFDTDTPNCDWWRTCLYASVDPQYQSWTSKCLTSYAGPAATSLDDVWARNSKHRGKGETQSSSVQFAQLNH